MKTTTLITFLVSLFLLSACYDDRSAAHSDNYVPELRYFDLVDSYDVDTAQSPHADLALSPFRYNGLFEFFWGVNSLEDYTISLKLNDRPLLENAVTIHSEVCGADHWCDQSGDLVCEYTEDLYMSCDNSNHLADVAPLFRNNPPQRLYLLLEVCDNDSSYCEYDYYPVLME